MVGRICYDVKNRGHLLIVITFFFLDNTVMVTCPWCVGVGLTVFDF